MFTSDQLPTNLRVPRTTFRLDNFLVWLRELRKALNLELQFYYSERTQIRSRQKKRYRGWILGGFQAWSFFVFRDGCTHLASVCDNTHAVLPTQEAQCAEFLLRFHYIGRLIELLPMWLNLIYPPSLLPKIQSDIMWPNSRITGLVFSVVASPHFELSC